MDEQVVILVTDQGEGIPQDDQSYIFEPFFTTKPPGEGTGLGLAMSYKIVADHQGTISIDSEPGEGTRVTIELPKIAQLHHEPSISY